MAPFFGFFFESPFLNYFVGALVGGAIGAGAVAAYYGIQRWMDHHQYLAALRELGRLQKLHGQPGPTPKAERR